MNNFILEREKCLLLVIDIQEKLLPVMERKDEVVKNTRVLIDMAKEMDIPIIFTEQYPKGLGATVESLSSDIPKENFYSKISYDAYVDDIKKAIDDSERPQILIAGMETHICVYQTARSLLKSGYNVFVAKDCVSSRTNENYRNGLYLMDKVGGTIVNTETILFDLLKVAGTEEFKKLSKLIK